MTEFTNSSQPVNENDFKIAAELGRDLLYQRLQYNGMDGLDAALGVLQALREFIHWNVGEEGEDEVYSQFAVMLRAGLEPGASLPTYQRSQAGSIFVCSGCGHTTADPIADFEGLRRAGHLSCCPERKMIETDINQLSRDLATVAIDTYNYHKTTETFTQARQNSIEVIRKKLRSVFGLPVDE